MNEQTPNEFTNEQYATFDQYLEEQIKRLKVSIDSEVPESGPFKDVFDLFTNPVAMLYRLTVSEFIR